MVVLTTRFISQHPNGRSGEMPCEIMPLIRVAISASPLTEGLSNFLLVPQRLHGIDSRRPQRGDVTGAQCHHGEQHSHRAHDQGVRARYAEED